MSGRGAYGVEWEPGPVVAWTESDGPGRVPAGRPALLGGAAAIAAATALWGFMASDDLCPEHSLMVNVFSTVAVVCTVFGVVGAVRAWVGAAPLILVASVCGVSIGVVNGIHDVTLSMVLAIGFGVAGVAAAFAVLSSARIARWGRAAADDAGRPIDHRLFRGHRPPVATGIGSSTKQPAGRH